MKKWIKKWWFSISTWCVAFMFSILLVIFPFIDEEIWWRMALLISSLSTILLLILIGIANQPRKENKDDN